MILEETKTKMPSVEHDLWLESRDLKNDIFYLQENEQFDVLVIVEMIRAMINWNQMEG